MHGRGGRNLPRIRQTDGRGVVNALEGNCVVNTWRVITASVPHLSRDPSFLRAALTS